MSRDPRFRNTAYARHHDAREVAACGLLATIDALPSILDSASRWIDVRWSSRPEGSKDPWSTASVGQIGLPDGLDPDGAALPLSVREGLMLAFERKHVEHVGVDAARIILAQAAAHAVFASSDISLLWAALDRFCLDVGHAPFLSAFESALNSADPDTRASWLERLTQLPEPTTSIERFRREWELEVDAFSKLRRSDQMRRIWHETDFYRSHFRSEHVYAVSHVIWEVDRTRWFSFVDQLKHPHDVDSAFSTPNVAEDIDSIEWIVRNAPLALNEVDHSWTGSVVLPYAVEWIERYGERLLEALDLRHDGRPPEQVSTELKDAATRILTSLLDRHDGTPVSVEFFAELVWRATIQGKPLKDGLPRSPLLELLDRWANVFSERVLPAAFEERAERASRMREEGSEGGSRMPRIGAYCLSAMIVYNESQAHCEFVWQWFINVLKRNDNDLLILGTMSSTTPTWLYSACARVLQQLPNASESWLDGWRALGYLRLKAQHVTSATDCDEPNIGLVILGAHASLIMGGDGGKHLLELVWDRTLLQWLTAGWKTRDWQTILTYLVAMNYQLLCEHSQEPEPDISGRLVYFRNDPDAVIDIAGRLRALGAGRAKVREILIGAGLDFGRMCGEYELLEQDRKSNSETDNLKKWLEEDV